MAQPTSAMEDVQHEPLFSPSPSPPPSSAANIVIPAISDFDVEVGPVTKTLKRPAAAEPESGDVSDDTEPDYGDLNPEEIEKHDEEFAWITGYLDGDFKLVHLPDHLHATAQRRMQRKMRRKRREAAKQPRKDPFAAFRQTGHDAGPSSSKPLVVTVEHDKTLVDLTDLDDEEQRFEAEKLELSDHELARRLQEEEARLANSVARPAAKPDVKKVLDAEALRRKQEEDDERLARSLQHQFDRALIDERVKQAKGGTQANAPVPSKPVLQSSQGLAWDDDVAIVGVSKVDPPPRPAGPTWQNPLDLSSSPIVGGLIDGRTIGIASSSSPLASLTKSLGVAMHTNQDGSITVRDGPSTNPFEAALPNLHGILNINSAAAKPMPAPYGIPAPYNSPSARNSALNPAWQPRNPTYGASSALSGITAAAGPPSLISKGKAPAYQPGVPAPPPVADRNGENEPDDVFEQPINDKEAENQLKSLLSNVAITADVPPPERRIESPADLKVTLLEHQKIGVEWMVKMEKGNNRGGILADDMGLGKTVQTPTSLILQWKEEIRNKVKDKNLTVFVYYGKDRKGKTFNSLKSYDFVLTTYGTVAMEWPQTQAEKKGKKASQPFKSREEEDQEYEKETKKLEAFKSLADMAKGELFKVKWYRIILDEAHTIKNKLTRTALPVALFLEKHCQKPATPKKKTTSTTDEDTLFEDEWVTSTKVDR
ncbi:hypothetical protein HDU96_001940 [Phlyctochytrium bullatum]|nr:hypothetical protein HDU96_001940 [Phlyctochytrium bullatum]